MKRPRRSRFASVEDLPEHLREQARALLAGATERGDPRGDPREKRRRAAHVWDEMNENEARYARRLEAFLLVGELEHYEFEKLTFPLAWDCTLTPDFLVVRRGRIEIHEVKGEMNWEDGWIKFKVAASLFRELVWVFARWSPGKRIYKITVFMDGRPADAVGDPLYQS